MIRYISILFIFGAALTGCSSKTGNLHSIDDPPFGHSLDYLAVGMAPGQRSINLLDANDIGSELTLEKATELALLHSPHLEVFAWSIRLAEAQRIQAAVRPNPVLEIEMENMAGSGPFEGTGNAETTIGVGQLIETGGRRTLRSEVAALEHELAGWDYEEKRLAVLTEVIQAFNEVLAAQARRRLIDRQVDIAKSVEETVDRRVQAGKDSPLEATKARVSLSQMRIEQKRSERKLVAARHALAATWGAPEPLFMHARGALDEIVPPPSLSSLQAQLTRHPAVARWDSQIKQREALVRLEKANARPSPTVIGGYRHLNEVDESAFVLGLSLPLPVTNRNQGNIMAAQANLARARVQQNAALVTLRTKLSQAYGALTSEYAAVTELEQEVLRGAQEAFNSAQTGYQGGKFDYLTVLDAQRTLFAVREQHLAALTAYQKAKAQVENLVGRRLDALERENDD